MKAETSKRKLKYQSPAKMSKCEPKGQSAIRNDNMQIKTSEYDVNRQTPSQNIQEWAMDGLFTKPIIGFILFPADEEEKK